MADLTGSGRTAELTIALSLATDLGTGQPMEHGMRTCWLSLAVSDALGLDAATRSCVYYVALLRFVGCTSDASETAELAGGDDVAFNAAMAPMLMAQPGESMRHFVRHLAEDLPLRRRMGRVVRAMSDPGMERRSLPDTARWPPVWRPGSEWPNPSVVHLPTRTSVGTAKGTLRDWQATRCRLRCASSPSPATPSSGSARPAGRPPREVLAHRRGHAYDPAVVDALLEGGARWIADDRRRPMCIGPRFRAGAGPDDRRRRYDGALAAIADFTDLKSPFLRGHSTGVARLATAAARAAGLSDVDGTTIGRAALVHDVGRVGIPSGIWDRPGPLSVTQWERVRLHTYLTERVLHRCELLAPFADLAARHHERADGSGYHRGASGDQLDLGARLLAAADAYHAMTEDRPHRPALAPADAASQLLDDVDSGRFGRLEVDAVLEAAGQASRPVTVARPAGLTEREVDVLRLIARGQANKQVAATLGISPKTVGHHIEHIYTKAAVTTRAGATLFAMEHDLL